MSEVNVPAPKSPDLPAIKQEVKRQFEHLPGVEGFGIGDGVVNVYISQPETSRQIPASFKAVPLRCIPTGIIEAR
ncbi:MAG: hypothetical protein ACK5CA_16080 [Cyanobacteriota bacterium]|jgi:hypothetical protein